MMTSALSDDEKVAAFRKLAAAWETKQWRTCVDLMAPDAKLHSMMLQPVAGREVIYERLVKMSPEGKKVKLHIRRIGVVDGAVVVERLDEITIDGVTRSVPVAGFLEFEGSLIREWREYYDRASLVEAQGRSAQAH